MKKMMLIFIGTIFVLMASGCQETGGKIKGGVAFKKKFNCLDTRDGEKFSFSFDESTEVSTDLLGYYYVFTYHDNNGTLRHLTPHTSIYTKCVSDDGKIVL